MKRFLFSALLPLALFLSCTTLSNDLFVSLHVDSELKAEAVAAQGVEAYGIYLEGSGDYTKVDEVRKYFEVALSYDPSNATANDYLAKVDAYSKKFVDAQLATAERLVTKSKRSEAEDYTMLVSLQKAKAVDPANERIVKLFREQKELRDRLVTLYLDRSAEAAAQAAPPRAKNGEPQPPEPTPAAREEALSAAYRNAFKADAVDPGNLKALKAKSDARKELAKLLRPRFDEVAQYIDAASFERAEASLVKLAATNKALEGAFSDEYRDLSYRLYYSWAKSLEEKKSLSAALDRVEDALAVSRTDEAVELKKRVSTSLTSAKGDADFAAALVEVDRLIASADIAQAQRRLSLVARSANTQARAKQVEQRRSKLRSSLDPYYRKGVAAYQSEDFKLAIQQLQVVVSVDPGYELAADYLQKAKEKQKLVDQFSD